MRRYQSTGTVFRRPRAASEDDNNLGIPSVTKPRRTQRKLKPTAFASRRNHAMPLEERVAFLERQNKDLKQKLQSLRRAQKTVIRKAVAAASSERLPTLRSKDHTEPQGAPEAPTGSSNRSSQRPFASSAGRAAKKKRAKAKVNGKLSGHKEGHCNISIQFKEASTQTRTNPSSPTHHREAFESNDENARLKEELEQVKASCAVLKFQLQTLESRQKEREEEFKKMWDEREVRPILYFPRDDVLTSAW